MRKPFDDPPKSDYDYAYWNYGDVIPKNDLDRIVEGSLESWVNRPETLGEIIDRRVQAYLQKKVIELCEDMT